MNREGSVSCAVPSHFVCHVYENDGKIRKSRAFTKDSDIPIELRH